MKIGDKADWFGNEVEIVDWQDHQARILVDGRHRWVSQNALKPKK